MYLQGKKALVTGSTSGIGLSIAKALAKNGASVAINGFGDAEVINKILSELKFLGGDAIYVNADMSKPSEIKSMIENVQQQFSSLDIVVNNAGIQFVSELENFPDEKWNDILSINLSAAFHTIKYSVPMMKKNNYGRIINIASAHGLVASKNKSAYVSAKHGIVGLTKVVALENAEHNITCNAICPGWVRTALVEKQINDIAAKKNISFDQAMIELIAEKQPSKRFVDPDEIGDLAVFLAKPETKSITGTHISIDGGWTAQ